MNELITIERSALHGQSLWFVSIPIWMFIAERGGKKTRQIKRKSLDILYM